MDSTTFSSISRSNSTVDESQISFGSVDIRPYPPTLVPIFGNLDQEIDLTIGSFKFRDGFLRTLRLLDPICLGPSANKTAATSETSVSSSSEANSPVSIKLAETSEDLDESGNPVINPVNHHWGANYVAEGEDVDTIAARRLAANEWATVKAAIEGTTPLNDTASRNVLMGYHYSLHRQYRHLQRM
jgi:hypothetical protein